MVGLVVLSLFVFADPDQLLRRSLDRTEPEAYRIYEQESGVFESSALDKPQLISEKRSFDANISHRFNPQRSLITTNVALFPHVSPRSRHIPSATLVVGFDLGLDSLGRSSYPAEPLTLEQANSRLLLSQGGSGVVCQFPSAPVKLGLTWKVRSPWAKEGDPKPESLQAKVLDTSLVHDRPCWMIGTTGTLNITVEQTYSVTTLLGKEPTKTRIAMKAAIDSTCFVDKKTGLTLQSTAKIKKTLSIYVEKVKATIKGSLTDEIYSDRIAPRSST